VSELELTLEPPPIQVRRLEVITGAGGRRRWSAEAKARIVQEAMAPGAVVSVIARRHGLTPQQVFTWRREARKRAGGETIEPVPFASVVVAPPGRADDRATPAAPARPVIEVVIGDAVIRVGRDADGPTLTAVLRAVRAAT
jgi:transposase